MSKWHLSDVSGGPRRLTRKTRYTSIASPEFGELDHRLQQLVSRCSNAANTSVQIGDAFDEHSKPWLMAPTGRPKPARKDQGAATCRRQLSTGNDRGVGDCRGSTYRPFARSHQKGSQRRGRLQIAPSSKPPLESGQSIAGLTRASEAHDRRHNRLGSRQRTARKVPSKP
jgi:hypothetical protein